MATYYTIHMQDLPSGMEHNDFSPRVYESFDDACDSLEKEIVKYDNEFSGLDRVSLRKMGGGCLVYHTMPFKMFGLMERTFVPKKQDKEFEKKWNQIPLKKRNELALAIQSDCRNIIAKIEAGPFEEDHPAHLKNAKYVLHCCRSDAVEELGSGELHPDWNEVHEWTQLFFKNDFYPTEDVFTVPITKKVWLELTS